MSRHDDEMELDEACTLESHCEKDMLILLPSTVSNSIKQLNTPWFVVNTSPLPNDTLDLIEACTGRAFRLTSIKQANLQGAKRIIYLEGAEK